MILQVNLAESQQSAAKMQHQQEQLAEQLQTVEGNAARLARLHDEAQAQLKQQVLLLEQVPPCDSCVCHHTACVSRLYHQASNPTHDFLTDQQEHISVH